MKSARQNHRQEPKLSQMDRQGWKSFGLAAAKICLTCAIALGIPYGVWRFYRHLADSDYFLPRQISISGNVRVEDQSILDASGLELDDANLFETNVSMVESGIETLSWVKKAHVKITLPDTVDIVIAEHEPRGIVNDGQLNIVDSAGSFIKVWTAGDDIIAPIVSVDKPLAECTEEAAEAFDIADMTAWRGFSHQIKEIHYDDATGYTLYTESSEIRLGYDRFEERIDRLMTVDSVLAERNIKAAYILLDSATTLDRIVVKPRSRIEILMPEAPPAPPSANADADADDDAVKAVPDDSSPKSLPKKQKS